MYGELRSFVLLYFLVDDTVEVREQYEPNDGRDKFPLLLRRQKVPRNYRKLPRDFPVIVMEAKDTEQDTYISPEDLGIGAVVNILGRDLKLYDCDEFTKEFYRRNFGVEDFTPLDVTESAPAPPQAALPPHTGFGTHEDSMQSVLALNPKPPRSRVDKLLEHGNSALRFEAVIDTTNPIESERKFVVAYQLAADTISIFEPKTRNTRGGKFLEAIKVKKPSTSVHNPEYYTYTDLYPGAVLEVYSRRFVLGRADDFAMEFIRKNINDYPQSVADALNES
jgi:hypothetical protein